MKPRILFVDDTADATRLLLIALSRYSDGFEADLTTTASADEALAAYRAAREQGRPFDLLVCDIAMPNKSGLMLVREIREAGDWGVKVIFFSGYDGAINRQEAEDLRAVDYLTKPTSPMELIARIRAALEKHGED